ncbi:galactokinase [Nibrella saemangeumensis]|uniref:Galactokinase n=1 Tax=Nibrella saemangeumensis TaxID=1084526 RepID=A0ABP8N4P5_9BACT
MELLNQLSSLYQERFQSTPPILICSPGRVNLIGEHTDYNEGFVLPAAIDKAIYAAVGSRNDNQLHFIAHDLNETYEGTVDGFTRSEQGWPNYLLGVIDQLQLAGHRVGGFNCIFGGTIPIGSGMSSSAALENTTGFALNELFNLGIDKMTLIKMSQAAEHKFVGVKVGIMDMFASMMGKAGHAIKLDCRSLDYAYAPLRMEGIRIVLCDTRVSHSLASSEYNTRRAECEAGVRILQGFYGESIRSLRDVTMEMLDKHLKDTEPLLYRRCAYVVQENQRLLDGYEDLERGDVAAFGQRMYGSHEGLSKMYEVSCPELDIMVDIARPHHGVLGARMMGGGFGGCTINLVQEADLAHFQQTITEQYQAKTGKEPFIYVCTLEDGTHRVN